LENNNIRVNLLGEVISMCRPKTTLSVSISLLTVALVYPELGSTQTARAQSTTAPLTDKFATVVLQGGCSVKLASTGQVVTTEGSGGVCPTTVKDMMAHLDTLNPGGRRSAVISEDDDHPSGQKNYRFVVTFDARSDARKGDILLSLAGRPDAVHDRFIEAMGFDEKRKAYVFYRLNNEGKWEQSGDSSMAPLATSAGGGGAPKMDCLKCHTTGMPLMRELQDSWGNWQSRWDRFQRPESTDPIFNSVFSGIAEALEPVIIAGTQAVAAGRVDRGVAAGQTGLMLKQAMCDVGEPSLIAVHERSSQRWGSVITPSSKVPGSIFINQILVAPETGSGIENGLDGNLKMALPSLNAIKGNQSAYVAAVNKLGVSFEGQSGVNDAKFAWFSPAKSYADLAVVIELLKRNLVDKDVLADAMMVDFTVPMFSNSRCALAETIPANFSSAEDLRTGWIANLANSNLRGAAGLKRRLENRNDSADHEKTIDQYLAACAVRSTSAVGPFHGDVLTVVAQRRNEFRAHYSHVVESLLMLPIDDGSTETTPGTWRLSATTCELEKQTTPFHGE
jgi:hypothetical protein